MAQARQLRQRRHVAHGVLVHVDAHEAGAALRRRRHLVQQAEHKRHGRVEERQQAQRRQRQHQPVPRKRPQQRHQRQHDRAAHACEATAATEGSTQGGGTQSTQHEEVRCDANHQQVRGSSATG
eukprot:352306-Chlamydomonas_euryale.AAC.1